MFIDLLSLLYVIFIDFCLMFVTYVSYDREVKEMFSEAKVRTAMTKSGRCLAGVLVLNMRFQVISAHLDMNKQSNPRCQCWTAGPRVNWQVTLGPGL